jgi:hypothetical protein
VPVGVCFELFELNFFIAVSSICFIVSPGDFVLEGMTLVEMLAKAVLVVRAGVTGVAALFCIGANG